MTDDPSSPEPPPSEATTVSSSRLDHERQRIGPYTILEKRGEGGMGIVYLAEQSEPVRRRVALKVIKHGMDTKQVIARFEAERQALAMMNHSAIAKIFDAGTTPDGRPYFAMEYIQGVPITEHCDQQKLTNRERLDLFLQVCEGVQHAHQKAVIHRDLKPSNVLVSIENGRPAVKIIDFGLAKALGQSLTERTLYTELGVLIGTPEYMSPEQAEMTGQDVDTRSDVYSLGVMLYELLVGVLPFESKELREAGIDEVRRRIREEDPIRPSARLSSLGDRSTESARRRGTEPKALRRELQGDLDWITMCALEKDRGRRYGFASDLAEEIRRHIRNEPVLAHAPSTRYRAWKFVQRHRIGVGVASVLLIGLLGFAATLAVEARRIARERNRANDEAAAARQVSDFLVNLFEVSTPSEALGNTITARELLDKGAEKIDRDLKDRPLMQARMKYTIGKVLDRLGLYPKAATLLESSVQIQEARAGETDPILIDMLDRLATTLQEQGQYDKAEPLFRRALALSEKMQGAEGRQTTISQENLAGLLATQGNHREAAELFEKALATRIKIQGPDAPEVALINNNLGWIAGALGHADKAIEYYRQALRVQEKALPPNHPDIAVTLNNLGVALWQQKHPAEAAPILERALGIYEKVLGPEHPEVGRLMANLAVVYRDQGDLPRSETLSLRALEIREKALGPAHPDVAHSLNRLGGLRQLQGRYTEAIPLFERSIAIYDKALGPDSMESALARANFADLYREMKQFDKAEALYRASLASLDRTAGKSNPRIAGVLEKYAQTLKEAGRTADAEPLLTRANAIRAAAK